VRRLAPARLRHRLALVMVLLVAAALLAVGVAQYVLLGGYLFDRTRSDVMGQASTSVRLSQSTGEQPQVEGSSVAVYDSEGRRVDPPELVTKRGMAVQAWVEPTPDQFRSLIAPFLGTPDKKGTPGNKAPAVVLGDVLVTGYPMVSPFMTRAFAVIGFDTIDDHHVSPPARIAAALERVLMPVARAAFPPRAPVAAALYQCTAWTKHAGRA